MSIKTHDSTGLLGHIHPFFISTLFFIIGIIVATKIFSVFALVILAASALFIPVLLTQSWTTRLLYLTLVIALPFIAGLWRYTQVTSNYFTLKQIITDKPFDCTGWVVENTKSNQKRFNHSLTIQLESIIVSNQIFKAPYRLKIYLFQPPACSPGDTLYLKNIRIKTSKPDFEKYLLKESSLGTLFLPNFLPNKDYECLYTASYSFASMCAHLKQRVTTSLNYKLNTLTNTFFCTIFLGSKPHNSLYLQSVKELFSYWGIIHYLARSGLHVALIVMIWTLLLRWLPLPYLFKQLLLISLIVLYNILTWSSISFVRAFVTFLLYKFCIFHNRPSHAVHILTLTTLGVLTINPVQLFFLDFQLSFALTFALAWFHEVQIYFKNSKTVEAFT